MNIVEVARLEAAGRSAMAWTPDEVDARSHYRAVLGAMIPAMGIIAAAAAMLAAIAA